MIKNLWVDRREERKIFAFKRDFLEYGRGV